MMRAVLHAAAAFMAAAAITLAAWPAFAQKVSGTDQPILFKADEVSQDRELGTILARGNVEITQGKRILMADSVSYNQRTETVSASGNVKLLEPTGDVIFADFVELTDGMKNGVVKQLRVLLVDDSRFAANEGWRRDGNLTVMKRGVYSPCAICKEDPDRPLVWQLKAETIEHDEAEKEIRYRNAFMEMFGIPVAYTPYFSHPDPRVKRKTGFLPPDFGTGGNLGGHVRLPYYIVLDKDKDMTVSPIYTIDEGLVMSGEYRQRFNKGEMMLNGSITEADRDTTENGVTTTRDDEIRGHFHAKGSYHIDDTWRAGLDSMRATDRTYLKKFNFFERGGLFDQGVDILDTNIFAEGFRPGTYGAANIYSFQDLRPGDRPDQPLIAPLLQYSHMSSADGFGGRMLVDSDFRYLLRSDGPTTQRVTFRPGYEISKYSDFGLVSTFSTSIQADVYNVDQTANPSVSQDVESTVTGRLLPRATVDLRYPLVRSSDTLRQLIEPVVMLTAAPNGQNPKNIPNEDSNVFEADDTNLLSEDRLPGEDLVESGQRVAYGVQLGAYGAQDGQTTAFIGQSYRLNKDDDLRAKSGIEEHFSDIVGRVEVRPNRYADIRYRFAFASDKAFEPRRSDVTFNLGPAAYRLSGSYSLIGATSQFDDREEVALAFTTQITDHWSMQLTTQRDLAAGQALLHGGLVRYQDECIIFDIQAVKSYFRDEDVEPSTSVLFRIKFKNLGEVKTTAG
jgi:LPS-assembly protein